MRFDLLAVVAAVAALSCAERLDSLEADTTVPTDAAPNAETSSANAHRVFDADVNGETDASASDASVSPPGWSSSVALDAETAFESEGPPDAATGIGRETSSEAQFTSAGASGHSLASEPGDGGAPALPRPCVHTFASGHGDVYLAYEALQFHLRLRAALSDNSVEQLYEPESVCIQVPGSTYVASQDFGGRPAGETWSFLGIVAGEPFWFLPQTARNDAPWLGLASAAWPSSVGDHARLSFRLIDAPGGSHFSAWFSDAFGAPQVELSSSAGDWSLDLASSVHAHLNWAFTRAGTYAIEVTATFDGGDAGVSPEQPAVAAVYRVEVLP